ncbi:Arc-like DNA binding domain-containing protein [Paenacidovorax caeni]|uniref:Arc-like DNA binding domain-containing protein n=1 Tax=Paenacidovorax caeni TaxID=343013 RepID=A0A1I7KPJ0_9BURK|nr:Arc family DNA-binding protein [Paenacidovorax caeni]SFU99329.1 Arc-like DNA binding domain-containing protein [Paenacidovorax caeni]
MAQDDYIRTALRVPPDLHKDIHEAADKAGRSFNAELIERLSSTFEQESTNKLLRGNLVLLRALADFVVLRHNHPEVMAPMEDSIIKMAQAIKETEDETKLAKAAAEPLTEYIERLAGALEQVNRLLGPGWAKNLPQNQKPKP